MANSSGHIGPLRPAGRRPRPGPREPAEGPGRPRLWAELAVSLILIAVAALAALGFVVGATGAVTSHSSRAGQVIGAVLALLVLVVCARWAISAEHRLRAAQPVAQGFTALEPEGPARLSVRRRRHYGPAATAWSAAVFAAGGVGCVVGAVSDHAQAMRSSYVQHHGTAANATAVAVANTEHCSRRSCHYTSAITVDLTRPVEGKVTTVVHYPGYSNLLSGQPVRVLVDPKQPNYAELPGIKFKDAGSWIVFVVIAVLATGLCVVELLSLRRLLAHRSQHLRGTRPAGALPASG